jgi:hypothetical protein
MLAVLLLLVVWATFPQYPLIAFLAGCGAAWAAKSWAAAPSDRFISLLVWGALIVALLTYLVT